MKQKLKLLLLGVITAALFITSAPVPALADDPVTTPSAQWPEAPELKSAAAVVIEASTGSVLYNKNAYEAFYPASTTKLMTSLLAIEQCPLSDVVTCSKASVESIGWDSSRIGLIAGESIDMENALFAILLASANEVSYAVAEHIGGTVDYFVSLMNERANDLGCVNTHFVNPHGLDHEEHYSCPYDLALIARKAMEYTTFRRVSGSYNHKIPATNKNEERWISNTHPFIKKNVVYEGVFAGKTGSTSKAGNCLVTCAERNGMTLICAIMKAPDSATVQAETKALLDYAFNNFTLTPLAASQGSTKNAFPVLFEDEEALISEVASPLSVSDTSLVLPTGASYQDLTKKITLSPIVAFASGENVIGEVNFYYADNYVGSADIIFHSAEDIIVIPSPTPTPTLTPVPAASAENNGTGDSAETSTNLNSDNPEGDNRPLIIGVIVFFLVLAIGFYIVLVELPFRRKKKAYQEKYGRRKS
ncbi:MAG: D-alanyl-D-alanine carboxypeptidase [Lachnospiraceae bacterium]|nr:D-alanyl-D-alanine carboxypeptidase [Lachnospiraceae bacterium]